MITTFEDWYYDECSIDAAEVVGPNSPEYEGLHERYLDDDTRREAAMIRYCMETGEAPDVRRLPADDTEGGEL